MLRELEAHGVRLDAVTEGLLDDGIRLFANAFEGLLSDVDAARRGALGAAAE